MTRVQLRLYFSSDRWLGPGKIQLLEAIRDHGSISAAARTMDMSYRRAWLLIEQINHSFREPAVSTTLGGTGGGAATLTRFGTMLITRYRRMEAAARRAIATDLAALERALTSSPPRPRAAAPATGTATGTAARSTTASPAAAPAPVTTDRPAKAITPKSTPRRRTRRA